MTSACSANDAGARDLRVFTRSPQALAFARRREDSLHVARRLVTAAALCALGLLAAPGADGAVKKYLYRVEISSKPVETWSSMGVTGRAEASWTGIWWVPVT